MQQAASLAARYESILRAYLEKIKRYPSSREARLARPEGIVRVWLELSRTGELIAVGILESSGFNLLDSETIKTIKSGTFPAFPDGAFIGETTHKFIANLNYTISSN
jgi:protein TonB